MAVQSALNVFITEFFNEGRGGIIINGESVGVSCAALVVEAMLCQTQEDFARSEEEDMHGDLVEFGRDQSIERMCMFPVL